MASSPKPDQARLSCNGLAGKGSALCVCPLQSPYEVFLNVGGPVAETTEDPSAETDD